MHRFQKLIAKASLVDNTCHALGFMFREGDNVAVGMEWHMAHELSPEFKKDFLRLRCHALVDAFDGMSSQRKPVCFHINDEGISIHPADKMTKLHPDKQKPCGVSMAFAIKNVDENCWQQIKTKFRDVFEPADIHGGCDCTDEPDALQISSLFKLAEKGGD